MRRPRDLSDQDLVSALRALGYQVTGWTGCDLRLTTLEHREHRNTSPLHGPLHIGTLASGLANIAQHFERSRDDLGARLFHLK